MEKQSLLGSAFFVKKWRNFITAVDMAPGAYRIIESKGGVPMQERYDGKTKKDDYKRYALIALAALVVIGLFSVGKHFLDKRFKTYDLEVMFISKGIPKELEQEKLKSFFEEVVGDADGNGRALVKVRYVNAVDPQIVSLSVSQDKKPLYFIHNDAYSEFFTKFTDLGIDLPGTTVQVQSSQLFRDCGWENHIFWAGIQDHTPEGTEQAVKVLKALLETAEEAAPIPEVSHLFRDSTTLAGRQVSPMDLNEYEARSFDEELIDVGFVPDVLRDDHLFQAFVSYDENEDFLKADIFFHQMAQENMSDEDMEAGNFSIRIYAHQPESAEAMKLYHEMDMEQVTVTDIGGTIVFGDGTEDSDYRVLGFTNHQGLYIQIEAGKNVPEEAISTALAHYLKATLDLEVVRIDYGYSFIACNG